MWKCYITYTIVFVGPTSALIFLNSPVRLIACCQGYTFRRDLLIARAPSTPNQCNRACP